MARHVDVFNGDADGICALHQLRLAEPVHSELVTGLKHEIDLLERVDAGAGDQVTVLDLSLARNRGALQRLLDRGATVTWFDHHYAGNVPSHPRLRTCMDPTGRSCTAELVDDHLQGRFRAWAVVAAFGDGLVVHAHALAARLGLDGDRIARLRELGESLNYNAYGAGEDDVLVPPLRMYSIVSRHHDPFALIEGEPLIARLGEERASDLARAARIAALHVSAGARVFALPPERWSRRVAGVFANRCGLDDPERAQAVIVPLPDGACAVSVRSPRNHGPAAADFCRRYPGGGGRATAAGIGRLEAQDIPAFVAAFEAAYGQEPRCADASRR